MIKDKEAELKLIQQLAAAGRDREVVEEINTLYQKYPDDAEIGFVWLNVAYKNQGYHQVIVIGERLLKQSKGLSRKAEISALMSSAAFYESNFDDALVYQLKSFFFLCMMADSGAFITLKNLVITRNFSTEDANLYLATTLSNLKNSGLKCAPVYGTLLGIQRDGKIIPHDKDIDIVCDSSIFEKTKEYFYDSGHVLAHSDIFENFISFKHPKHLICVDISAAQMGTGSTTLGFTPKGFSKTTWKYEDVVPKIRFNETVLLNQEIYSIENSAEFLQAVYGKEWETSQPNYIPFLDSQASIDSGLRRFYANLQILKRWLSGDIKNALRGSELLSKIDPFGSTNIYVKNSLLKTMEYFRSQNSTPL